MNRTPIYGPPRQLSTLPPEQRERLAARLNLPPPQPARDGLWCGHPGSAAVEDDRSVPVCSICTPSVSTR